MSPRRFICRRTFGRLVFPGPGLNQSFRGLLTLTAGLFFFHLCQPVSALSFFQAENGPVESRPVAAESRPAVEVLRLRETDLLLESEKDPSVQSYLAGFAAQALEFEVERTRLTEQKGVLRSRIRFDSSRPTGRKSRDRVLLHGFEPVERSGPMVAVLLLHHLQDDTGYQKNLARRFAAQGVAAYVLEFPGYGERKEPGESAVELFTTTVDDTVSFLRQCVADIRRSLALLRQLPEVDANRVSTLGVSLGAIIGALAAGVDATSTRTVWIMGGGDLAAITMTPSRETRMMRRRMSELGINETRLRELLRPVDPLTFAHRIRGADVLSITAEEDQVVVPECHRKLADRIAGINTKVWPGNHYTLLMTRTPDIFEAAREFLTRPFNEPIDTQPSGR